MKKTTMIVVVSLIGMVSLKAQMTISALRKMPAVQKAQLITDSFKTILSLTNDQYPKVYATILKGVQQAMPVMQSDNSRMTKARKLKAIVAEQEAGLKPLLTARQYALYQQKKKNAIAYYRSHFTDEKLVFNVPEG